MYLRFSGRALGGQLLIDDAVLHPLVKRGRFRVCLQPSHRLLDGDGLALPEGLVKAGHELVVSRFVDGDAPASLLQVRWQAEADDAVVFRVLGEVAGADVLTVVRVIGGRGNPA